MGACQCATACHKPDMTVMPALSPAALISLVLLTYLVGINAVTWGVFWYDKRRAGARKSRVSEFNLLFLCAVGGTIGAFAARRRFRHKTRKRALTLKMKTIAAAQVLALGYAAFVFSGAFLT